LDPWLLCADEVDHIDARLKVSVGGHILVMSRGCDVVGEAEAVEALLVVHVQEALVGAVKGDTPLGHGHHGVIVAHVRSQNHKPSVEQVWPANVGRGRECMGKVKELIGRPVSHHVGINIDNLAELGLLPQIDLGEGRVQVPAVHEIQIGRVLILNATDGDDIVIHGLIDG
jgi:hypothetical protein